MKKNIYLAMIILVTAFTLNAQSYGKQPDNHKKVKVFQNYPNPFSKTTTVKFHLTEDSIIKIFTVNKISGEKTELADGFVSAGEHGVIFKAPEGRYAEYICTLQVFSGDSSTVIYSEDITMTRE